MSRKPVDLADRDNPEWTEADFAQAQGPEALSEAELGAFPRTRRSGRPKAENPKQQVTLRLDADILERFREGGPGWQSRINAALQAGDVSEALADLLRRHAGGIESLRKQLAMMRGGKLTVHSNNVDVTVEEIERVERQITESEALMARYAPLAATATLAASVRRG